MSDVREVSMAIPDTQQELEKPLNRRFDFSSYSETRIFLDRLADLSKREGYYPNISFGATYVNITMDAEGRSALEDRYAGFTREMETLAQAGK